MGKITEGVESVVKTVATPLRYFAVVMIALVLLIIMLAWKSALPSEMTMTLIKYVLTLLVLQVAVVPLLIVLCPKRLVFDQEAHLA